MCQAGHALQTGRVGKPVMRAMSRINTGSPVAPGPSTRLQTSCRHAPGRFPPLRDRPPLFDKRLDLPLRPFALIVLAAISFAGPIDMTSFIRRQRPVPCLEPIGCLTRQAAESISRDPVPGALRGRERCTFADLCILELAFGYDAGRERVGGRKSRCCGRSRWSELVTVRSSRRSSRPGSRRSERIGAGGTGGRGCAGCEGGAACRRGRSGGGVAEEWMKERQGNPDDPVPAISTSAASSTERDGGDGN